MTEYRQGAPGNPRAPDIDCHQIHPGLAVLDVPAAIDFYVQKLGFWLGFTWGDPPTTAGVNLGHVQVIFDKGEPEPTATYIYFLVDGTDELYEFQRANGVEIVEEPGARAWGIYDYTVRDLNGYYLSFGHHLLNMGPPVVIERVDVPVRLEKRLAALLYDLAKYKHMSPSSCLEEILLHTSEPLGDGVASPHTKGTLRYIQKLKEKHGIDYDCHASYRFKERGEP